MNDSKDSWVIGESTPIKIGLVISFLTIFGTGIWWASSINSKLDSIIAFQNNANLQLTELKATDISMNKEISDLKLEIALDKATIKRIEETIKDSKLTKLQ